MKDKGKKPQETLIRRPYEKPLLIDLSTATSRGKNTLLTSENGRMPTNATALGPS